MTDSSENSSFSQRLAARRADGAFWAVSPEELLEALSSSREGLRAADARTRLAEAGPNSLRAARASSAIGLLARQFRNPLVLVLILAAAVSAVTGDGSEAAIIAAIVLASSVLSFFQEHAASKAMEALLAAVAHQATVMRDGSPARIAAEEIVPGDVVALSAGSLVPADGRILAAEDFNVSEAALTGETFPVSKMPGASPADARLGGRTNSVFAGTSVSSGTARMLVVRTGRETEVAAVAATVARAAPETEFAKGIRRFGYLMTEIMLAIVILVFVANLLLSRPLTESLLFSLSLAVGLTPELLPAIISVTLSRGARAMAAKGVIVRRLESIENLGSMDLLCTDKTGTLTEGVIRLDGCLDTAGQPSGDVRLWALLNATLQSGMENALDQSISALAQPDDQLSRYRKIQELPYDFVRKRLSVIVRREGAEDGLLICKGAVRQVLEACSDVGAAGSTRAMEAGDAQGIDAKLEAWGREGYRVLGLAVKRIGTKDSFSREDEAGMAFAGFLLFMDPPKPGVALALAELRRRGIAIKVISGDNRYVAGHLAEAVGLGTPGVLTGDEIAKLPKEALLARVQTCGIFAEIDPGQKERIIAAFRSLGHVVGYMGDGINDAPALHEADIGISVQGAADVAREAADMVLLEQDLAVLLQGVDDGRATFANTMKYICITTSANFGNMVSMAIASVALPFLPLLAPQILLNNFLSDLPMLAIASDNVDDDAVQRPPRWNIGFVKRFMVAFGLVSSAFDAATFIFLMALAGGSAHFFQTGWFVESLLTELAVVLVVRTRGSLWRSSPSRPLALITVLVAATALAIPYLPGADWLGFVPLPLSAMAGLAVITVAYVLASDAAKQAFYRSEARRQARP